MDAIIFFVKERGLKRWKTVSLRQENYLLIRVEMDAGRASWFGRELPDRPEPPGEPSFGSRLKKRSKSRAAQREYLARQQAYELFFRGLRDENRRMAEEIGEILRRGNVTGTTSCVYEKELLFLAEGDSLTGEIWRRFIDWPLFRGYTSFPWMRVLLAEVCEPEIFLLGFSEAIPPLLEYCGRGMRKLRWYLAQGEPEARAEEMAENFYLEYGLAASIRVLEGAHPFRKPGLTSRKPVCVLDFTEEEKIFPERLAAGSLWIDFLSVEEKEERLRRFAPGVGYLSLKKRWKTLQPKAVRAPELSRFFKTDDRLVYNPGLRMPWEE